MPTRKRKGGHCPAHFHKIAKKIIHGGKLNRTRKRKGALRDTRGRGRGRGRLWGGTTYEVTPHTVYGFPSGATTPREAAMARARANTAKQTRANKIGGKKRKKTRKLKKRHRRRCKCRCKRKCRCNIKKRCRCCRSYKGGNRVVIPKFSTGGTSPQNANTASAMGNGAKMQSSANSACDQCFNPSLANSAPCNTAACGAGAGGGKRPTFQNWHHVFLPQVN